MTGRQIQRERYKVESSHVESRHNSGPELIEENVMKFSPMLKNLKGRAARLFRSSVNGENEGF